jgi:hypothetical protein
MIFDTFCDNTIQSEKVNIEGDFMSKTIDLSKNVFEVCRDNPDVIEIMKSLGFESIADPAMLSTVGRFMTIPKGAAMKNVSLDIIKEVFKNKGYDIIE